VAKKLPQPVSYIFSINIYQMVYVAAKIRLSDFGNGAEAITDVAKEIRRSFKVCGNDQLGHVIPFEWGGKGHGGNIFAQNGNVLFKNQLPTLNILLQLNMAMWKTALDEAGDFLKDDPSPDTNER
jgi:hypothetical protein